MLHNGCGSMRFPDRRISMFNWVKTALLMAAITALFGVLGAAIGGRSGMFLALAFALVSNFFAYWFSDKMVLRMYNAQEVDDSSAPQFYGMVRELAERAGLPMPKVYLIDEEAPNAFATGRNPEHAAVAATTGILRVLSSRELRGVMAHELAHVKNRDILISTISATMAGAISALANFAMFFGGRNDEGRPSNPVAGILVALLAPLAGALLAGVFGTTFGGNWIGRRMSHTITILGVLVAFVISAMTLKSVALDGARFNETLYTWMVVGGLKMEVGFLIDSLTAMMMVVVTFVSLLVHVYTSVTWPKTRVTSASSATSACSRSRC